MWGGGGLGSLKHRVGRKAERKEGRQRGRKEGRVEGRKAERKEGWVELAPLTVAVRNQETQKPGNVV